MGIPDDTPEFWYHLFAVSAVFYVPTAVIKVAKMSNILDKRARISDNPFAVLPGIVCMTLFGLLYMGLMIPATFLHVDENHSGHDKFYSAVNWMVFVVAALMTIFPHVYTIDYYSSKAWRKYTFGSWHIIAGLANMIYPFLMITALALMIIVCIFCGLDHRVVPTILYSCFTAVLLCASVYFTLEWRWCASKFNKVSKRRGITIIKVIEVLERDAEEKELRELSF